MRYRPDLDGIRAFAVLAVIAFHSDIGAFRGSWMGVDVFFVLSGYLITTLLLAEHAGSGSISLRRFYARRALRLYPALILMLLVVLPFARQLGGFARYGAGALASAMYLSDFALGFHLFGVGPFGHTWSLGVEEQFYIVGPLLLLWLLRRHRDPLPWAIAATLASWAALAATTMDLGAGGAPPDGYFLPWSRFSQLLIGSCVAIVLTRREPLPAWRRAPVGWVLVLLVGVLMRATARISFAPNLAWEAPAIAILTAALLFHLHAAQGGIRAVLGWKPFAYVGRRSYGIYLFHAPVLALIHLHFHSGGKAGALLLGTLLTFALAFASYRVFELPFLRLKHRRFEPPSHRPEPVPT